jgi:hypothetical protein
MRHIFLGLYQDESGHGIPAVGDLVAVVGAIILAVGASGTEDVVTILGGVILAVGILASGFLRHVKIDYDIYDRLDRLEKSAPDDD